MSITQAPPAPRTPERPAPDAVPPRPASVVAGTGLAVVLAIASIAGLVAFGIRLSHDRYTNDHSRFDYPGPVYAFILVALVILVVGSLLGVVAGLRQG